MPTVWVRSADKSTRSEVLAMVQFAYTQTTFSTAVINLFLARCEGANGVGDFACQLAVPIAGNPLQMHHAL